MAAVVDLNFWRQVGGIFAKGSHAQSKVGFFERSAEIYQSPSAHNPQQKQQKTLKSIVLKKNVTCGSGAGTISASSVATCGPHRFPTAVVKIASLTRSGPAKAAE